MLNIDDDFSNSMDSQGACYSFHNKYVSMFIFEA